MANSEPTNELRFEIRQVNGVADESAALNLIESTIQIDEAMDEYPLKLDFESTDDWVISSPVEENLWVRDTLGGNGFLRASGFSEETLGSESWFISPELNTGGLDSAGLSFRVSYAERVGFNDQLAVLVSYDCGESYSAPIFIANADSLAVTSSSLPWVPSSEDDWKDFTVSLEETIAAESNLRIAFVFINGNGNDLYLDDINIRANDPPSFEERFLLFPNPLSSTSNRTVHLGFNFLQKQEVTVTVIGMNGGQVSETFVENALNQVITINAPDTPGLYFVRVSYRNFMQTQKLLINP